MSVDTNLLNVATQLGRHCAAARNSDNGDTVAAAIALNLLVYLRETARECALTPDDLQSVINTFTCAAAVEEVELPMGNTVYQRGGS